MCNSRRQIGSRSSRTERRPATYSLSSRSSDGTQARGTREGERERGSRTGEGGRSISSRERVRDPAAGERKREREKRWKRAADIEPGILVTREHPHDFFSCSLSPSLLPLSFTPSRSCVGMEIYDQRLRFHLFSTSFPLLPSSSLTHSLRLQ